MALLFPFSFTGLGDIIEERISGCERRWFMNMDLQKAYHDKFISMDEALANIKSGDVIAVAAYGNEPVRFLMKLRIEESGT